MYFSFAITFLVLFNSPKFDRTTALYSPTCFRYFDEIVVKYSREKEQLQFKLEAIKEERLQSINERIDTLFDQQKQLKYYVQVNWQTLMCLTHLLITYLECLHTEPKFNKSI